MQYILVGVLAVGLLLVGVAYAYPEEFEKIPIIGDTVQTVYYANVEYEVFTPWEPLLGQPMDVEIVNVTLEKKIIPLSIGPLFDLFPATYEGKVVIQSVRDDLLIARAERDVKVETGWLEWHASERFTDSVKLGLGGSGTYTIKVTLYDKQGNWVDEDVTTRTI